MRGIRTAVIVRAEDGIFQPMLLKPLASGPGTTIYRIVGCVLRRSEPDEDGPAILSIADLREEVFVFVNIPLETANHLFVDALVKCAARPECGIASGVLMDEQRRIVDTTRTMPFFFAVTRERFLKAGGLGVLSSRRMPQLFDRLLQETHAAGLQHIVTSDGVATLAGTLSDTNRHGRSDFAFL